MRLHRAKILRNNIQQHATGCANGRNMQHATVLGVVGQQCCVRLHAALDVISLMIKSVGRAKLLSFYFLVFTITSISC